MNFKRPTKQPASAKIILRISRILPLCIIKSVYLLDDRGHFGTTFTFNASPFALLRDRFEVNYHRSHGKIPQPLPETLLKFIFWTRRETEWNIPAYQKRWNFKNNWPSTESFLEQTILQSYIPRLKTNETSTKFRFPKVYVVSEALSSSVQD